MSRPAYKTAASFPAKAKPRGSVRPVEKSPGLFRGLFASFRNLIRRNTAPKIDGAAITMTLRNPFRAVGVVPGKNCCQASQQGTRYLCEEAPRLPLSACTNPSGCRCTYRHFEDRRKGPRRHRDGAIGRSALFDAYPGNSDRRHAAGGRRITD